MRFGALSLAICLMTLTALQPRAAAQWSGERFRVYSLQHADPAEVRRMLAELLGPQADSARLIADPEQKQLAVAGSDAVHQLAAQLIREADQPVALPREQQSPQRVLRSYPVPAREGLGAAEQLRSALGDRARIAWDGQRDAVVVSASEETHAWIRQFLSSPAAADRRPAATAESRPGTVTPAGVRVADAADLFPVAPAPQVVRRPNAWTVNLQSITAHQCQLALRRLLGEAFRETSPDRFEYVASGTGSVTITIDRELNQCHLRGDRILVDQFVALIRRFEESRTRAENESWHFLPMQNVDPQVLERAIRLWRESTQPRPLLEGPQSSVTRSPSRTVRPAAWTQIAGDAGADAQPPDAEPPATSQADADPESEEDLSRPSDDVTVQPLPDLDVLILRGRDADVDELVRIIQEIERLSEVTAPEIDVYFLRHVQDEALDELIEEVLEDLTGPLQGKISITPLVKPNALLLIGWGEAVAAAKKLVAELDRPVQAHTQMRVFPLRHAPADEISGTIEDFLNGRGGLGPDVGVTADPRTNSLIVHAAPRDLEEVVRLIEQLDVSSAASVNQARMVRLRHALADDVAQTITEAITAARGGTSGRRAAALEMLLPQPDGRELVASGLLEGVTLTPDTRTNTIVITGPADSLPLVEQLIRQLDESPTESAQIKVFQVANGDASDLVTVLRSLFPEAASTSTVPQLATAEGETSLVPVRFSVDARTNTIIATGTSGDLQIIEALLIRLDQSESQERINRVYRLENSPATEVANAVNDFLRSERIVSQAAPGRLNPFEQIEQEVVVVPEPVRNSLIISATPRYFEQILQLVEDLDAQPPQVLIQVILAEVDLENFHEFGVELGLQDSLLFDRSLLGDLLTTTVTTSTSTPSGIVTTTEDIIIGATNTPGFNFNNNPLGNSGSRASVGSSQNVAGQALSHFSLGRMNSQLEYGGLVLSASSENVSVLLRALDQSDSMEVLSRPQIMTLDNQPAFIQVGERVPRIVNSQLTQLGQINSLALEDVGLLLGVTPRISPEGQVVMEIDAEKSEVGAEREGIPISVSTDGTVIRSPRVEVTTAQTTVSAASGQTIIIGGLITNQNQSLSRRVPWLGDLPVLGNLFRYDGYQNRRTELLIILTPHVIRGRTEAEYVKQVEMARMSWMSCDAFEWLDPTVVPAGSLNDEGVPVIYPDDAAHTDPSMEPPLVPPSGAGSPESETDTGAPPPPEPGLSIPQSGAIDDDVFRSGFSSDRTATDGLEAVRDAPGPGTARHALAEFDDASRETPERSASTESRASRRGGVFGWSWGKK